MILAADVLAARAGLQGHGSKLKAPSPLGQMLWHI